MLRIINGASVVERQLNCLTASDAIDQLLRDPNPTFAEFSEELDKYIPSLKAPEIGYIPNPGGSPLYLVTRCGVWSARTCWGDRSWMLVRYGDPDCCWESSDPPFDSPARLRAYLAIDERLRIDESALNTVLEELQVESATPVVKLPGGF